MDEKRFRIEAGDVGTEAYCDGYVNRIEAELKRLSELCRQQQLQIECLQENATLARHLRHDSG